MRIAVPLEQCWHDVPGGVTRTTLDTIDALAALDGGDLELVGIAARHPSPPPPAWQPSIPVHHLRLPRPVLYELWHAVRRPRVERATGPVDLVHNMAGAVAPTRSPMVVTLHDLAFEHHPEAFTRHGLRFHRRALALAAAEAAAVVVPSQATARDVIAHGIDPARVHTIGWGIDPIDLDDAAVVAAKRIVGIDGPYVVVVGTLEPRKNLRRLLEAWARIDRRDEHGDSVRLVVVGPDGWGDAGVAGVAGGDVLLTGFVDTAVRDALYRGALASVYPSLFEGFGLPVLESMAAGCPVITSAGTATEELVAGGGGVAVDPTDVDALAGAVAALLGDPAARDRIGRAGRAEAARRTRGGAATALVEVYREVLGR